MNTASGLTPASVRELVAHGHQVLVEHDAGNGVAIDQGGCAETSRPTTHADPTYVVDGVVHYCVANMPGAVPRTSTYALNHATLPYVLALADQGWRQPLRDDAHLCAGLNVCAGQVCNAEVASSLGYRAVAPQSLL